MIVGRCWISNALLVGLTFHKALAVIPYRGQVPLLSSKHYSSRATSAASIFEPVSAVSDAVKASHEYQPNIKILDNGAEPQQPTGQISWINHLHQQQQPTKTELSQDGAPLYSKPPIGGPSWSS